MQPEKRYIKQSVFYEGIFPQYQNFCGICSAITVTNASLGTSYTQDWVHRNTTISSQTKRGLTIHDDPAEDSQLVNASGMSNWDIIRLLNTLAKATDETVHTGLITGKNYVSTDTRLLTEWFSCEENYLIFHLTGHYVTVLGFYTFEDSCYWIVFDSSRVKKQPVSTIPASELEILSTKSEKYGAILISSNFKNIEYIMGSNIKNQDYYPIESRDHTTIQILQNDKKTVGTIA